MTYREAVLLAAGMLGSSGIEYADNESRLLIEHVCQADLGFYLFHADEEMSKDREECFFALVDARCERVPLQHLTGVQEFMGISIKVSEEVLIPRQDTELLAEEAIRVAREALDAAARKADEVGTRDPDCVGIKEYRILDLCTGSGCIAIAIKSGCPEAVVYGSDISERALLLASENAAANGLDVQWLESDMFSDIDICFDMIVSNPPYIPTGVLNTLMPEVRDHEPSIALDGGRDGLNFYRRIFAGCGSCLRPGGQIMVEIGSDQADAVTALMDENGFEEIRVIRDYAGLDRVVSGRQNRYNAKE